MDNERRSGPPEVPRPHAPRVGRMRRLLGSFHFTSPTWYRLAYWGLEHLPWAVIWLCSWFLTLAFLLALWSVRVALGCNLDAVLGPAGFWRRQLRAYRTLLTFSWCLAERNECLLYPERFSFEAVGLEFLRAVPREQGIIFVTAHVGPWEMASRIIGPSMERPAHVVREEELDPAAQRFTEDLLRRHAAPGYTTHFVAGDPALALALADSLKKGEVVALQGDRPRAGGRAVKVEMFGRAVDFPTGPASLARLTGAVLLPVFALRDGRRRYRLVIREPIPVPRTAHRSADTRDATQRLATEVEWAIRQRPHQWFCLARLWP
jgi:lauroyl/myristoyl acyltransferase